MSLVEFCRRNPLHAACRQPQANAKRSVKSQPTVAQAKTASVPSNNASSVMAHKKLERVLHKRKQNVSSAPAKPIRNTVPTKPGSTPKKLSRPQLLWQQKQIQRLARYTPENSPNRAGLETRYRAVQERLSELGVNHVSKPRDLARVQKFLLKDKRPVARLQAALVTLGFGSHLGAYGFHGVDGRKGFFTEQALKAFRQKHGEKSDAEIIRLASERLNQGKTMPSPTPEPVAVAAQSQPATSASSPTDVSQTQPASGSDTSADFTTEQAKEELGISLDPAKTEDRQKFKAYRSAAQKVTAAIEARDDRQAIIDSLNTLQETMHKIGAPHEYFQRYEMHARLSYLGAPPPAKANG